MSGKASPGKSGRRRSRELVLQGLYQWQLAGADVPQIARELSESANYERADQEYFGVLLAGCAGEAKQLRAAIEPHLDRAYGSLTPIERAILLIAAFELLQRVEIPFRVIINEAVELAKSYGGTDAHKYVNGVLDKMAPLARPAEVVRSEG